MQRFGMARQQPAEIGQRRAVSRAFEDAHAELFSSAAMLFDSAGCETPSAAAACV
jgi:hypothetical protein